MTATKIEWAEAVWNPVVGCSAVSAGCSNCYAIAAAARVEACDVGGKSPHYAGLTRESGGRRVWTGKVAAAPDAVWLAPLRRRKPTIYFVNSMGDLFHDDVPDDWIDRAFAVMALCSQHKFIVLTTRATRMRAYLSSLEAAFVRAFAPPHQHPSLDDAHATFFATIAPNTPSTWPLPNVALGVSVEDQASADDRIPHLLATPAAIRLISAEPLLGPVDLEMLDARVSERDDAEPSGLRWIDALTGDYSDGEGHVGDVWGMANPGLDWVIAGGESGKGSRPCHPDWARGLRDQCARAGVPFFWKQWGDHAPGEIAADYLNPNRAAKGFTFFDNQWSECWSEVDGHCDDEPEVYRIGKAKAGALLDGQLHRAAPDGWLA